MAKIDVINQTGAVVDSIELNDAVFGIEPNQQAMYDVLVMALAGRRQGTSATKGRSEVSGGGRKPFRQKGTGRARASVRSEKLLNMGFDGIIAACGNYIEMDGKVIYENDLSADMVQKVIRVLSECKMPVVLEGSTDYWIDDEGFENDPYVDYLFESLGEHAHIIRGYDGEIRINKFSADVIDGTDYERVKAEFADDFLILEHVENVVEFVPKGTSKATGIKWLCNHLDIPLDETYAIGDSVNDLEMLESVGHGIAMGNSMPPVKEIAEYVTSDISDDGVKNALKHYGLI